MKPSELHSGDLLYWRGTGFKAALVRWWTNSVYSHVGMFWRNGNTPMVIEADSKYGVVARPFTYDFPDAAQKTEVAWTPELQSQVLQLIGKPYSWWTDAATVFCVAGKGSKALMCSELVTKILTMAKWDWHGYTPTPEGVRLGVQTSKGYAAEKLDYT